MVKLMNSLLALVFTALLGITIVAGPSMASTQGSTVPLSRPARDIPSSKERDLSRIVSVLESRVGNRQLPAKVRNKLAAMDDKEIRLLASLCDRVSQSGETAGSDLALMLAAALIVLS